MISIPILILYGLGALIAGCLLNSRTPEAKPLRPLVRVEAPEEPEEPDTTTAPACHINKGKQ